MRTQVKRITILVFSFILIHGLYSQQVVQAPYTLVQVNTEIAKIDSKLGSLNNRIFILQQQQLTNPAIDNSVTIANANESVGKLEAERKGWVAIKTSIEFAQNNSITTNESKVETQTVPQAITVYKQADFDQLPEHKKQNILSHPELYTIEP